MSSCPAHTSMERTSQTNGTRAWLYKRESVYGKVCRIIVRLKWHTKRRTAIGRQNDCERARVLRRFTRSKEKKTIITVWDIRNIEDTQLSRCVCAFVCEHGWRHQKDGGFRRIQQSKLGRVKAMKDYTTATASVRKESENGNKQIGHFD